MNRRSARWRGFPALVFGALVLALAPVHSVRAEEPAAAPRGVDPRDATVLIRVSSSLRRGRGSGFIIGDGGWVVTAFHVVAADFGRGRMVPEGTVQVLSPWTGRWYEARLRAFDLEADIALLQLETTGLPALPLEGLEESDPGALATKWKGVELRLSGFPADLGIDATEEQAAAELATTHFQSIGKRGKASVCLLDPIEGLQSGWSGGAITRGDTGAAVAVFHSAYRPNQSPDTLYPAGSLLQYLTPLLKSAGVAPENLAQPSAPSVLRSPDARARTARQIRSMTMASYGRWEKVEAEQRENLTREGESAEARLLLGIARAAEGDLEGAIADFQQADAQKPASTLLPLYLGLALQKKGEAAKAEAEFRRALVRFPNEPEAQLGLARALVDQEKTDDAIQTLRAARERFPHHPAIHYQLGLIALRQKHVDEALKDLRVAVDLTQDFGAGFLPMRIAYGRALEADRQNRAAEEEYRTVLRRDPNQVEARFYLANLYWNMGKIAEAKLELERLRKLEIRDPVFVTAFKELDSRLGASAPAAPAKGKKGRD